MSRVRHVHFYVAVDTELLPGWEACCPPFVPRSSYSVAKNNELMASERAAWGDKARTQVDHVAARLIAAKAFDFYADIDDLVPVPGPEAIIVASQFVGTDVQTASGAFLRWATERVGSDNARITMRCERGAETRHLIRCEAFVAGELVNRNGVRPILPELYYGTSTDSLTSPLCPRSSGDPERILQKVGLSDSGAVMNASQRLARMLVVYERAGLLVSAPIPG